MKMQRRGPTGRGTGLACAHLTLRGQFYSVVELVEKDGSVSSLLKVFNDQGASDSIVQFLRLLTSAFIRNRAEFFRHFVDEEMDIKDFCTHVGPLVLGFGDSAPALGSAPLPLSLGDLSTSIPKPGDLGVALYLQFQEHRLASEQHPTGTA